MDRTHAEIKYVLLFFLVVQWLLFKRFGAVWAPGYPPLPGSVYAPDGSVWYKLGLPLVSKPERVQAEQVTAM